MANYYRNGAHTESSSPYDLHAPHRRIEHEGDNMWDSTGSRASTWSSQNESVPRNSGSVENWSADIDIARMEDQTRPRPVIRRKPVPNSRPKTETEGGGSGRKRTESMSSGGSFSENSGVGVEERRPENSSLRRPTESEAKQDHGIRSTHFELIKEGATSLITRQDGDPVRISILIVVFVVALGLIWSIFFSRTGPVMGLTPSSPIIAIMGETGAGKSSFIKALGGRDDHGDFPMVGHSLNSTTKKVAWYSAAAGSKGFYILDTPGFDDSYMSDFDILEGLTKELAAIYNSARPLTGIIYVHDVSKEKMGGSSHKSLRTFQKLVGEESMQNVVLVTTHWRTFFKSEQIKREEELRKTFWAPMITRGSKILRHDGSQKSAVRIVKEMLDRKPVVIKIVDEMVNKKLSFVETDAGGVVKEGLKNLEVKLDSNIAALNDEVAHLKKSKKDAERASEERMKELEKQWKTSSQKDRQDIEQQMKRLKSESDEQLKEFNKQLTSLVYQKQQLAYQVNDLKKANEALRNQLSEQQVELKLKQDKEGDVSDAWATLFGFILWMLFIAGLIGLCRYE